MYHHKSESCDPIIYVYCVRLFLSLSDMHEIILAVFRLSKKQKILIRVLFIAFSFYGFSLYGTHPEIWNQIRLKYAGRLEFLTNIGSLLTVLTLAVSIILDIFDIALEGSRNQENLNNFTLLNFKNTLIGLVFPIETAIFLLYWTLKVFAPHLLVNPKLYELGIFMPLMTDFCLHVFPTLFIWLELFVFSTKLISSSSDAHPLDNVAAFRSLVEPLFKFETFHGILVILFDLFYILWVHHLYALNHCWVYPLFGTFSVEYHGFLLIAASLFSLTLYSAGWQIHAKLYAPKYS